MVLAKTFGLILTLVYLSLVKNILTLTVWTICGIWELPIEKTSFESNDDNISKLPKLGQLKPSSVILNQKSHDVINIERFEFSMI